MTLPSLSIPMGIAAAMIGSVSACGDGPVRTNVPASRRIRNARKTQTRRVAIPVFSVSGGEAFRKGLSVLAKTPADYEKAAAHFSQAAGKGGFAEAFLNLALCRVHLGDLKRARKVLLDGLKKTRNDPRISVALAEVDKRRGDYKTARKTLEGLLERKPDMIEAHNLLAQLLVRMQRYQAALAHIQKVLAADPKNGPAYTSFGLLYLEKGDPKTALMIFSKGLALRPTDPDLLTNKAVALMRLKQTGRAVEFLEKAVRLEPGHVACRLNLGKVYMDNLDYRGALNLYNAVLARWPNHLEALFGRARALFGLKQFPRSLSAYKKVLGLRPGEPRALFQIGVICQNHLEKPAQALLFYKKFVAGSPGLPKNHRVFTIVKALEAEVKASRQRPAEPRPPARSAGGK